MNNTINFGIDLGTTNSLIATCVNGVVEIFKNPVGFKETLPSVVGFRKDRILIGDKAREYIKKDSDNVISCFKRKMGTSESFFIPNLSDFKTPIDLSAMVLNELKNFVYTGNIPQSVVITIPASFDTVQSNATKQAGLQAGFKEVLLLQEPIAASLAFVNKGNEDFKNGKWLVYDLGGGTFDVALVSIKDGEMFIKDHEGDNYLGGLDIDALLIEKIIVPHIETKGAFKDLLAGLKSASGKYHKMYAELLYKAEEAKIALSAATDTEVEFEMEDDNGDELEIVVKITREAFNELIQPKIAATVAFIHTMLSRNNIAPQDLKEIILIGGSTYIPFVRTYLFQQLNIPVNASVDPSTAVVVGAAYYAATKTTSFNITSTNNIIAEPVAQNNTRDYQIKMAYQKNTNERDEYFSALIEGETEQHFYRITRQDGGFDSGLKPLEKRIEEVLSLLPNGLNQFSLKIFNSQQSLVYTAPNDIVIVQGKFSIYGQSLPNDICLEVDDTLNNTTYLELLFEKNAILPIKKTITKTLSRTIVKGSDDQLLINVLEGGKHATPQSNLPIGVIAIKGKDITTDLIKGSDIDLTIEITESRDIRIKAFVNMTDQEYEEVFTPTTRTVNIDRLKEEIEYLIRVAEKNIDEFTFNEDYESSAALQKVVDTLESMQNRLDILTVDDLTDEKFQIDEQKRKMAYAIDVAGKEQRLRTLKEDYFSWKETTEHYIENSNNESLKRKFKQIEAAENDFLSGSEAAIKRKIEEIRQISWDTRKKDIEYLIGIFYYYSTKEDAEYSDIKKIKLLKERGDAAIERRSAEELLNIIYLMYDLWLNKEFDEPLKGTGLS